MSLSAGRELDALVAVHIMGWQPDNIYGARGQLAGQWIYTPEGNISDIPHYSTDIAAAWQVVEKLRERSFYSSYTDLSLDTGKGWYSWHFHDHRPLSAYSSDATASTVPLAICLAALKAVGAIE